MMNSKKIMMMAIALMLINSGNAVAAEGTQQVAGKRGSGKGYRYGRGKKQGQRIPGQPHRIHGRANHAWLYSDGLWRTGNGQVLTVRKPLQQPVQPVYLGQPVYNTQGQPATYQGQISYQGGAVQPAANEQQHIREAVAGSAQHGAQGVDEDLEEGGEPAEPAEQP